MSSEANGLTIQTTQTTYTTVTQQSSNKNRQYKQIFQQSPPRTSSQQVKTFIWIKLTRFSCHPLFLNPSFRSLIMVNLNIQINSLQRLFKLSRFSVPSKFSNKIRDRISNKFLAGRLVLRPIKFYFQ